MANVRMPVAIPVQALGAVQKECHHSRVLRSFGRLVRLRGLSLDRNLVPIVRLSAVVS